MHVTSSKRTIATLFYKAWCQTRYNAVISHLAPYSDRDVCLYAEAKADGFQDVILPFEGREESFPSNLPNLKAMLTLFLSRPSCTYNGQTQQHSATGKTVSVDQVLQCLQKSLQPTNALAI